MKGIIIALGLWFFAVGVWAQNDEGAKIVSVSQAIQNNGFTIQVGIPFLGQNDYTGIRLTTPFDIRFPWDALYLYQTFADESFNVSKGYFGDKILINWDLRNNFDLISSIKIYKRIYNDAGDNDYEFVGSVSPAETSYEDKYVEGGVLYEYKVVAEGVSTLESLYNTYISGVGYRNPTAVVTGNVSYKGGNPVKDAILIASSDGSGMSSGSSLSVPASGKIGVEVLNIPITDAATFQAWIKPENAYTNDAGVAIKFIKLSNLDINSIDVEVNLLATSKILSINVGVAEYRLHNYFPSGKLNARGDDVMVPVTDFNTSFVHFSIAIADDSIPKLYINGRAITVGYKNEVNADLVGIDQNYLSPYFDVTIPTQTNILSIGGNPTEWEDIYIGGGNACYIDEIRIWKAVLEPTSIRTDYARYISGNDSRLVSYLSANEKVGSYAYDLSRNGFDYNKNHGILWNANTPVANKVLWVIGSGNFPTTDQLGILGVTDINGNYEITAIPYSGTGESFNITPMYGQHQFEPSQQLVFLGQGSEVVNKINFVDISSFSFKGKALFDSRGVFKSFVEVNSGTSSSPDFNNLTDGDEYVSGPGILDEAYNYYKKNGEKFSKGEYWYNDNGTLNDDTDDYLERYARIASEGVSIYVDGNIVLDENNMPVASDSEGNFEVSVPIGNHYISLRKDGHVFRYNGRYPAEPGTYIEFFEDSNEQVIFVDSTKVTVVGRVVGGAVEAQKVIGFGQDGLFENTITNDEGNSETITISSKNNIGVASITLGYSPIGAAVTPYTKFNFLTNIQSGEYRVSLLPLIYKINQSDLTIVNNSSISLLDANETVNVSQIGTLIRPEYEYLDGTKEFGNPYHHVKSFTYRDIPVLRVTSQTSDSSVPVGDTTISTIGLDYPIYTQFSNYQIVLKSFERYINYDDGVAQDIVPVIDGDLIVTNNLALAGSARLEFDPNDGSIINYYFKGGLPSISTPFTKTIDIKYRINGIDYPAEADSYNNTGIILGGQSDGSQTFITKAPTVPDIILRDPPGSNSFASIQEGESITFTTENEFNNTIGLKQDLKLLLGVTFAAGGGLAGPVIKTEAINNVKLGIGLSKTSTDGKSLTKSYSFSQTISTSSDPGYVGSDGDLYIGQTKNYFYGSYDDVQTSNSIIGSSPSLLLTNDTNDSVFISKQKAMYFVEQPSETFFIYSQKHILNTLIPDLELIIYNLETGVINESDPGVLTLAEYKQEVYLWQKTILENERSKYLVKNDRASYKAKITSIVNDFNSEITSALNDSDLTPAHEARLKKKLNASSNLKNLLDTNFEDNISFDAGVGEFSRSVETSIIKTSTKEINLIVKESFALEFGFKLNSMGLITTTKGFFEQDINSEISEEEESTTTFAYTLKDNDPANLLSVDVVNLFDGYGPVFSTIGGRTSCPYEGAELSHFYNHADYHPSDTVFSRLPEAKREQLSFATQKAEDPLISVEVADKSNVPEGQNAEFLLRFENRADLTSDAASFNYFKLIIDNKTNPNNALINISQNGAIINIPYGEPVFYALTLGKSVSDVFDYENIRVVLESRCDPINVFDDVLISAHFVPSCSEVAVDAPLNNWVYNMDAAFNLDGSANPVMIKLNGFNTNFSSFKKIDLEYRLATSPTWTRLQTYYTTLEYYDQAVLNNETEISLIAGPELSNAWDIAGLQLQDGNYEIRARSTCTNNTEFISDVISGRVDLHSPQRFGTPLPIDGILGVGEDLMVSFNESVFYNSAVSNIEIKGQTNQLPVNHNVSLHFEGVNNTAVINNPKITSGDLTFEFWMQNSTQAASATIIQQSGGLSIGLNNGELYITIGDVTASGIVSNDNLFHHYTFTHRNNTGEISIYEDDREIAGNTGSVNLQFTNNFPLVIGGNTFIGNLHDLRLWIKTISLENAYARMYDKLIGNESRLIGYWPMDEGRGNLAKDLARYKHAVVNAAWDIKPKGNSYEFASGQYLELDNVDFVQLNNEMDATISFWMKTGTYQNATLFSNGKGDGTDIVQSNGFANKWAISLNTSGMLNLHSEGNSYLLTSQRVDDNNWHHITLLFNRIGSLKTYVDAELVTSNQMAGIGGFSGNKIWLGARGFKDLDGFENIDNSFVGKIDEFRLWNTLRNFEQISRDRYNEVSSESIGLVLYARMNEPKPVTGNGPRYYHAYNNQTVISSLALLNVGEVAYSDDAPPVRPERALIKFQVNHVINEDDMILEPIVSDWASLEGQILDITVHRMFDNANNMQQSPVTWTAYVKRNEVTWFADGYNDIVDIVKIGNEEKSFEITILNKGGKGQPFNIANVPDWLTLSTKKGTIGPDSKITTTATIDQELTPGEYLENLYLQTDFGFDEKMQLKIRVLVPEPDWIVNPDDFELSMSIVGKIKIDGTLSSDPYDIVAAFSDEEVRGSARLVYNEPYQEYFAFLTVYSNSSFGDTIDFRIWDASQGKILEATMDGYSTIPFIENEIIGTFSQTKIFENSNVVYQEIDLNQGWTWISLNVNDPDFNNLNSLIHDLDLKSGDRIMSHSPSQFDVYTERIAPLSSGWNGTISSNGGLSNSKMYKLNLSTEQSFKIRGTLIDMTLWNFPIKQNWNWLPYPLHGNYPTNEALAYFNAADGNVIKSQNLFAIYDPINGWNGTLNYMVSGTGYMISSSLDQSFQYPDYLVKSSHQLSDNSPKISAEFTRYSDNMNAVVSLPEGYNQLFVYDRNGILKGISKNQFVYNKELCFITIFGDHTENLVFYIGDEFNIHTTTKSISFNANYVKGSVADPIVISLQNIMYDIAIYPNPFNNDITVEIHSEEKQTLNIKLYSITKQLVYSKNFELITGANYLKIEPEALAHGMYLMHIQMNNTLTVKKVVKK